MPFSRISRICLACLIAYKRLHNITPGSLKITYKRTNAAIIGACLPGFCGMKFYLLRVNNHHCPSSTIKKLSSFASMYLTPYEVKAPSAFAICPLLLGKFSRTSSDKVVPAMADKTTVWLLHEQLRHRNMEYRSLESVSSRRRLSFLH